MIKLNTLIDIFKCLKSNGIISIDDLLLHGLTNKDVNMLVKSGTLKYDNVFYSFGTIEKLYEYGTLLLEKENYKNAKKCFEACILIDSKCSQAYFMLFLLNIKNSAYDKAFLYYDGFCEDIKYRVQARVFIYLLSKLISVPAKYESSLSKDEIMNMESKEEIKYFIESQSCDSVMVAISRFIQDKGTFTLRDKVLSNLVQRIKKRNKRRRNKILNLIMDENYEELMSYLENLDELTKFQKYVLKLVRVIVSKPSIYNTKLCENVFEAIDNYNFELALYMCCERNDNLDLNEDTSVMYILLKKINEDLGLINKEETPTVEDGEEYSWLMDEVYRNGLVLFYKDDSIYSKVDEILNRYSSLKVFYGDNYVAFKYSPVFVHLVDYKKIISEAEHYYNMNNLYSSLKSFRKILESKNPEPFVFARLGLIYLRLNKYSVASDYLRVATSLSSVFDFAELLDLIDSNSYEGEFKPYSKFSVRDFCNDIDKLKKNSKIRKCVESIVSGKCSLDEINKLSCEEKQMATLAIAREYYHLGEYKKGDKVLRVFEKMEDKSREMLDLLEETRINKLFYKYRGK